MPWAPWLGLLVAFSPVWVDQLRHAAAEPWAGYSLLFGALFARALVQERRRPAPAGHALAWLAAATALEIVAIETSWLRLARPLLPLAAMALCRAQGLAPLSTAAIALWFTPIPSFVVRAASPGLEGALARLASLPVRVLDPALGVADGALVSGGAELPLRGADAGIALLALLSGFGWYRAVRAGDGVRAALARAAAATLAAPPLALLQLALAAAATSAGRPEWGRAVLDYGWLPLAALLLLRAERGRAGDRTPA